MNEQVEARFGTTRSTDDGRIRVHFERKLSHAPERVWSCITDQAELDTWMPGVRFDRRTGGRFEIWFGGECEGPAHVSGEVVAYDPPTVLQLGTIRWELAGVGDGCRLTFTDVLVFEGQRSRREIANAVLGGWHLYLDLLEDALAGRPVDADAPEPDYAGRDLDL